MLASSVALRLSESSGTTWWLISVPASTQSEVAAELREQLEALDVEVRVLPGELQPDAQVTLWIVTEDQIATFARLVDDSRSQLANEGVLAFILAEPQVRPFLQAAPHVASFIGGKVLETSADEDEASPELTERRLASLREAYAMTDDEARAAFRSGHPPDELDFLEWMVLLGDHREDAP